MSSPCTRILSLEKKQHQKPEAKLGMKSIECFIICACFHFGHGIQSHLFVYIHNIYRVYVHVRTHNLTLLIQSLFQKKEDNRDPTRPDSTRRRMLFCMSMLSYNELYGRLARLVFLLHCFFLLLLLFVCLCVLCSFDVRPSLLQNLQTPRPNCPMN